MFYRRHCISYLFVAALLVSACGGKGSSSRQVPEQRKAGLPHNSQPNTDELTSDDIIRASLEGDIALIRQALEQGIDIQPQDRLGRTPLMFASYNGHTEIVRLLLEQGAEVNKRNSEGRTSLMFAASGPFPGTVKLLLQKGADPNARDAVEGWTALMYAAAEGNVSVVNGLMKNGADATIEDHDGDTAIDFAANNGHSDVIELLKE